MLNPKQKKFVLEYIIDFNGTRAAIAAGYSNESAAEIAYENLRKPQIAQFIEEHLKEQASNYFLSKEMILIELCKYAFNNKKSQPNTINSRDSISALKLLGMHLGLFWDKPQDHSLSEGERILQAALKKLDEEESEQHASKKIY